MKPVRCIVWIFAAQSNGAIPPNAPLPRHPLLDKELQLVVVGSQDGTVYGLDAQSGWVVWRFRTGKAVISSPCVVDGVVYVGSADNNVYALEAKTGRQVWKYATEGQVNSSPAVCQWRFVRRLGGRRHLQSRCQNRDYPLALAHEWARHFVADH